MAYEVYLQELLRIGIGQTTNINWHNKQEIDVGEPEYLQMCYNKTGCMPRLAGRLAAILSGADEKTTETIGNLCGTIGVAFQIQDDCLSASGGKFAEGKGYGDDITEGKRSLPVIYTLKAANEKDRRRLIEILNMHTTDRKLIDEALAILKRYGSVEKAKKKTRELVGEAWAELDKVLKPSEAKEKIKAFAYYLIERDI
jgi:geranylgeranyl diphosphate synthase type I